MTSLSLLGRDEEARAEAEEVLRINPKFSLESHTKISPHFVTSRILFRLYDT
jgi:hypothetical protein